MKKGRKIVKRDTTIDLLKGIGITSIVIGHVRSYLPGGFPIVAYVYTYHIMVFLFVAGMCFKPQNNISPFMQIGKRLGGLLPLYVIYSAFFVACHNLFRRAHILSNDIPKYGKREIVQNILNSLTFGNSERLLGAFWFVPMFFVAVSFFIIVFYKMEQMKKPIWGHTIVIIVCSIVGIVLNYKEIYLNYRIQTSILGISIIYLGYFYKRHCMKCEKYLKWWYAPILGVMIWGILSLKIGMIELSVNQIMHPALFYPVTVIGILFCLCLAEGIKKVRPICKMFTTIGKNSYHIMALHFLAFKCVDLVAVRIFKDGNDVLEKFTVSYEGLWYIYYIAGIAIPIIIIYTLKYIRNKLSKLKV